MLPVVFVPGMMCDARLFFPQVAHLHRYFTMVSPINTSNTIEALAANILKNTPKNFALVGLSMGGIVAMEMLRQESHRISKLALFDTNPLAEKDEVKQNRNLQIQKVKNGKLEEVLRDEMKPNYLANPKKEILKLCMQMALNLGAEVFIKQSHALQNRIDQRKTLAQYKGQTLILQGEHDQLCPDDRHQLMHALITNSHYLKVPKAGHLPTLENPEFVNQAIVNWLQ